MKKLRVGVIGLGTVAEAHLIAYQNVDEIDVVAVAELRQDRLDQFVKQYGFKGFTDYHQMLEQEVLDIVCILVPASHHRKVIEDIASYHIAILCEKPLAVTMEDALAIQNICEKEGIPFYYGASYRSMPAILEAKKLIDAGKLGKVTLLSEKVVGGNGRKNYKELNEHHYPKGGPGGAGLGLMDHGIHLIDLFTWFTDSEVKYVIGRGNISGEEPQTEYLLLQYENGALGELLYNAATFSSDLPTEGIFSFGATWDIHDNLHLEGKWDEHPTNIRIHGEEGALRIFPYANKLFYFSNKKMIPVLLPNAVSPEQFGNQLRSFAYSLINNTEIECTLQDGINSLRIALAAYESYATLKPISINKVE